MDLNFQIVYSRRKTVALSVERDASVIVHAPEGTPREKIHRLIEAKRFWLYQKINHDQKYPPRQMRKEFVSGETILYLGRNYRLQVTEKDVPGVVFQSRFEISRKNQPHAAELFKLWYLRHAEERIPQRAIHFADALGVGFNRILISDLKVRWGSCTPKSNLNFNWRLMKAPPTVIDYVIVHELAHLIEPNHTPRFWNIVSIQVPRFTWAKHWLRDHGDVLETDF
jgi:predicted metal-dependent hydrolase